MRSACLSLVCAVCLLTRLPCVSVGAEPNADSGPTTRPQLEEVILVFKTHFDIGYTDMASAVVERYRTSMIDSALDVVDDSRSLPKEQQFVWTIPGWPMAKILEDWEGQTPERKRRVMDAFRDGRFVVHGLSFTTHTETLSEEDLVRGLSYSTNLSRAAGLEVPRDAKMTDVPCHSWIVPTLLAHAGIQFMHEGNLFNNQWNTNFRLWNEGTWKQTVRIWTFEKYDPESSLIRPALEARFPMVGRTAPESEKRGTLPTKAAGLELSRHDVLVTSFGVDPASQKLMLRLWEQAGKDGPCTITFPRGLNVSAARPCDLRGRPLGEPLPVADNRLIVDIRHNAPLNLELIRSTTVGGSGE